jgi:hypothetical protein
MIEVVQLRIVSVWETGTPSMLAMTEIVSGLANSAIVSPPPASNMGRQRSRTSSTMMGSIAATARGEKARLAQWRSRVWSGGSMLRTNPGMMMSRLGKDENSCALRRAAVTWSKREIMYNGASGAPARITGAWRRIHA